MATNPWLRRSPLLLLATTPLWPLGCGPAPSPSAEESGGTSGVTSGTSSGTAGFHAGAPGQTGGTTGTAGHGLGGAAGTATNVGGAQTSVGGAQTGVGGAQTGVGGGFIEGGAQGVAGGPSGSAGISPSTGGAGPVGGAGSGTGGAASGSAGMGAVSGTGPVDPCATVTCGADQVCSNGTCMCSSGKLCSSACVDTTSDANNCGDCGTKCAAGGACVDSACVNPMCNPDTMTRSGHITHYDLATSMVACHYPTSSLPQYYGAMNEYDWNNAGVCGACVEITNGGNKLVVQITDECPYQGNEMWCFNGSHHVDLNSAAYSALGANNNPAVTWKYVACNPTGNIKYYFDSASQQYYLAVTPMNHKNLVAKMEVKKGSTFTALTHSNYNTYVLTDGAGTGMLTFRLTDIYNHVLTDTVTMSPGQTVTGNVQFPACP